MKGYRVKYQTVQVAMVLLPVANTLMRVCEAREEERFGVGEERCMGQKRWSFRTLSRDEAEEPPQEALAPARCGLCTRTSPQPAKPPPALCNNVFVNQGQHRN